VPAGVTGEGSAAERQIAAVVALAQDVLGHDLVAVYLYGSATLGGLQNHSDIDLFVLSARSLTGAEKRRVVDGLLQISCDPARGAPSWQDTRPLEVTIAARPGIDPWHFPPAMELQYGEWLRTELEAGAAFSVEPTPNADLALLLESVRRAGRPLVGPPARVAIGPIPAADLARAMLEGVEEVRPGIETGSDTTNGLLTLARIWFTLSTGEMAPKDMAADWAIPRLTGDDRAILERARGMYLGEIPHGWRGLEAKSRVTGERLAGQVLRTAQEAGIAGVGEHSRR
jgi:Domain of unknown function (DUF4111)